MRGIRAILRTGAFAALLAAVALAAAPAWAGPGATARVAAKPAQANPKPKPAKADRPIVVASGTGIVQSVLSRGVVVRELDGRIVRVPVAPRTLVFVNGVRATLGDVEPGYVARFSGRAGSAVRVLRAVDPSPRRKSGAATVESVSHDAVVVSGGGDTLTIPVDSRTRVLIDGRPATLDDVRPGDLVSLGGGAAFATKPVRLLRVRRPG